MAGKIEPEAIGPCFAGPSGAEHSLRGKVDVRRLAEKKDNPGSGPGMQNQPANPLKTIPGSEVRMRLGLHNVVIRWCPRDIAKRHQRPSGAVVGT